jgi:hypothetical protein
VQPVAIPTFYDLTFDKLESFASTFGSASDKWGASGAGIFSDPLVGVGFRVSASGSAATVHKVNVFAVSVTVFFKTATAAFTAPPVSSCPQPQQHDPDLSARAFDCPPTPEAQCQVVANLSYGITVANCDAQPAPTFTVPSLIAAGGNTTCPLGSQYQRTWFACQSPAYAPYNLPPVTGGFNCTQNITVVDTIAPVLTCADDMTIACGAVEDGVATVPLPTVLDECDGTSLTIRQLNNLTTDCGLVQLILFEATDRCGNVGSCTVKVTVNNVRATLTW